MAGSYLPLVGQANIVSILDTAAAAILPATIDGVAVTGRPGKQRTALLVALDDAATPDIPATTSAALFSIVVKCPPGFSTPADPGDNTFDYSSLLPIVRAECLAENFNTTDAAWPVDMTALITEFTDFPPNLTAVVGRLTAMAAPSTSYPYGTMTFSFTGSATTGSVADALVAVTIDFCASVAN